MDYFPYNLEYSSFSDTKSRERQSQAIELPYPNELPFVSWARVTISLHVAGKHQKGWRKVIKASTFNSAFAVGREHCQPLTATCLQTSINCNLLSLFHIFFSAFSNSPNTDCSGQFLLNFPLASECWREMYSWAIQVFGPPAQGSEEACRVS